MSVLFIKRLIFYAAQFYMVGICVTLLLHILPGSPFEHIEQLPETIRIKLEQSLGLGGSIWVQLINTVKSLSLLRFGPSLSYPNFDAGMIALQAWPISLAIGIIALACALPLAIVLAIRYALNGVTVAHRILLSLAIALPVFAKVYFLITFNLVGPLEQLIWQGLWAGLILCLAPAAQLALILQRLLRQQMQLAPYRYAMSCGNDAKNALYSVALRPALAQLIRFVVPITVALLTGSSIVEKELMIPGLGRWFVDAVSMRDGPMVLSVTAIFCLTLLAVAASGELLQARLAPQQRRYRRRNSPAVAQPAMPLLEQET